MYYYIYKITNLLTDEYYIGQRRCKHSIDFDTKYMGSGLRIRRAIKKYGVVNFSKIIIQTCQDIDALNVAEAIWIGNAFDTDKLCLNLKSGGSGCIFSAETKRRMSDNHYLKNKHMSLVQRQKIANSSTGRVHSIESNKKRSVSLTGRIISDSTKQLLSQNHADQSGVKNGMFGKHHTTQSRRLMSERSNHAGVHNGMFGKQHTQDSIEKMKIKQRNRSTETLAKMSVNRRGLHWWTNGSVNIISKDCPSSDFKIGRSMTHTGIHQNV